MKCAECGYSIVGKAEVSEEGEVFDKIEELKQSLNDWR